ncbi:unnamed protein product, partial [Callosobruchus maculatus]
ASNGNGRPIPDHIPTVFPRNPILHSAVALPLAALSSSTSNQPPFLELSHLSRFSSRKCCRRACFLKIFAKIVSNE